MKIIIFIFVIASLSFFLPNPEISQDFSATSKVESALPKDTADIPSSYDIDSAESRSLVINKDRPISLAYTPADLTYPDIPLRTTGTEMQVRNETAKWLEVMFDDASRAGHPLILSSGFRSSSVQAGLFSSFSSSNGLAEAEKLVARAGTSEHQTGWAADVYTPGSCIIEACFGQTEAGKWVAKNSADYGYIVRYLKGKEDITGYSYEPWHLRYVGHQLAQHLVRQNLTLEEFFEL